MARNLFARGKIGVFVDAVASGLEKRGGNETKVIKLALRVDSFDAELAGLIDEGLGMADVRAMFFRLDDGEPKPLLKRSDFTLPLCPRQRLDLYATPDTASARLCFDQVKIDHFYVRTQKDTDALSLCFRATFGPAGREQLEAAHAAYRSQLFIVFEEAEPSLAFDDESGEEDTDDLEPEEQDEEEAQAPPFRPETPMWDEPAGAHRDPPAEPLPRLVKRKAGAHG